MQGDKEEDVVEVLYFAFERIFYLLNMPENDDARKTVCHILSSEGKIIGQILESEEKVISKINDSAEKNCKAIAKLMKEHVICPNNPYANEILNNIEELISLYKFVEVEKSINFVDTYIENLSINQKENFYFQKARIFINKGLYEKLPAIKKILEKVKPESKFIPRIDYYVALKSRNKDEALNAVNEMEVLGYTSQQVEVYNANALYVCGELYKAKDIIIFNSKLKEKYNNNDMAWSLYADILMQEGRFTDAKIAFNKAYNLRKNAVYAYAEFSCQVLLWLQLDDKKVEHRHIMIKRAKELYDELVGFESIVSYMDKDNKAVYCIRRLILLNSFDSKNALKEALRQKRRYEKNQNFRIILSAIYSELGEVKKAITELEKCKDLHKHVQYKLHLLIRAERWPDAVNEYKKITSKLIKEDCITKSLYYKAISETEGYESAKSLIESSLTECKKSIGALTNFALLTLEHQDIILCKKIVVEFNLQEQQSPAKPQKLELAMMMIDYGLFELCESLCENDLDDELIFNVYAKSLRIHERGLEDLKKSYSIVDKLYKRAFKSKKLIEVKALHEVQLGFNIKAFRSWQEYKEIYGIDKICAYYYVSLVVKIGVDASIDEEIAILLKSKSPQALVPVSFNLAYSGRFEEGRRLILKSLYLSDDNLDEDILISYTSFFYSFISFEQGDVDLETVEYNTVIVLEGQDNTRQIAIHRDTSTVKESGIILLGCETYFKNDAISILLKASGKLNEELTVDGEKYIIKSITEIHAYFFRYCLQLITKNYPDNQFISVFSESVEENVEKIKDLLIDSTEKKMKMLEEYNFKRKHGLPLSMLSGHKIFDYKNIIISLIQMNEQFLYTGNIRMGKSKGYVLSISSIIILCYFDLLPLLNSILDKCFITDTEKTGIRNAIDDMQGRVSAQSGFSFLNEDGKMLIHEHTDSDKEFEMKFWANISKFISDVNIIEDDMVISKELEIFEDKLLFEDLVCSNMSKDNGFTFICDDLFIRKLHNSLTTVDSSNNAIGLIFSENLLSEEEMIELITRMLECGYLYALNGEYLSQLLIWSFSSSEEQERNARLDKVKKLIDLLFIDKSQQYYLNIVRVFYEKSIENGFELEFNFDLLAKPLKVGSYNDTVLERTVEK